MQGKKVEISNNFKRMTVKAVLSIVLFVITYLLLIALAVGLTILCGYLGILLIELKPMFITIMVGIGLISVGVLILIFLVKFIFKRHVVDRSHLIEITQEEQPKLFESIREIVKKTNTRFPKRIYLSADVNASVFYNSSFWSMILPIRKNLQIGMGLINSLSETELKAVIAHEFGHFSQRTMKVGSYVYSVNQIIYNLLYDNTSFESLAQSWASINSYFAFFVGLAVKIVEGIQSILKQMYKIVNLNYMGLSREMEFHADAVAANVVGSKPLITSLLRLDLANQSYDTVLDYYNKRIKDCIKTKNLYPQQLFVMNFLASESKLQLVNNLPQVNIEHLSRYNKSKLVIEDQWASHPSTQERVQALTKLNIENEKDEDKQASILFTKTDQLQSRVTERLFLTVNYKDIVSFKDDESFKSDFTEEYHSTSFNEIFNGYYNSKNIETCDIKQLSENIDKNINFDSLFSDDKIDLIYTTISLENDINQLNQISNTETKIKSFDYDGTKYSLSKINELQLKLKTELTELKGKISENDININSYFLHLAKSKNKEDEVKLKFQSFFDFDNKYNEYSNLYVRMLNETDFINYKTPFEKIEQNFVQVGILEKAFKPKVKSVLNDALFQHELNQDIKDAFTNYLSKDWIYFDRPEYNSKALDILFTSVNNFQLVLNKTYYRMKKDLLDYFTKLQMN